MCDLCQPNRCDICKGVIEAEFRVSDTLWAEVTGCKATDTDYANGYWCLSCFIKSASNLSIRMFKVEIFPVF